MFHGRLLHGARKQRAFESELATHWLEHLAEPHRSKTWPDACQVGKSMLGICEEFGTFLVGSVPAATIAGSFLFQISRLERAGVFFGCMLLIQLVS